jgi:hypothetical protein
MPFHHRFDIGPLVAWNHYEAGDVARDPIILGRRKLDLLDTSLIAALTVERQRLLDAVLFSTFINPLINPAKQLLVMCRSVREAHQAILPDEVKAEMFERTPKNGFTFENDLEATLIAICQPHGDIADRVGGTPGLETTKRIYAPHTPTDDITGTTNLL